MYLVNDTWSALTLGFAVDLLSKKLDCSPFKSFVPNLFKQRGWHVLGKFSLLFSSVCDFEQEAFTCG